MSCSLAVELHNGQKLQCKDLLGNFQRGVQGKWLETKSWTQNARLQEVDHSGTLVGGHFKPLPQVWWLVASLATCYLSWMHFWTPLVLLLVFDRIIQVT